MAGKYEKRAILNACCEKKEFLLAGTPFERLWHYFLIKNYYFYKIERNLKFHAFMLVGFYYNGNLVSKMILKNLSLQCWTPDWL